MERYTTGDNFNDVLKNGNGQQNSTSLSDTLKDEVNQLNSHFEKLCQQAAKTQKVLQDCLVDSLEVLSNANIELLSIVVLLSYIVAL